MLTYGGDRWAGHTRRGHPLYATFSLLPTCNQTRDPRTDYLWCALSVRTRAINLSASSPMGGGTRSKRTGRFRYLRSIGSSESSSALASRAGQQAEFLLPIGPRTVICSPCSATSCPHVTRPTFVTITGPGRRLFRQSGGSREFQSRKFRHMPVMLVAAR